MSDLSRSSLGGSVPSPLAFLEARAARAPISQILAEIGPERAATLSPEHQQGLSRGLNKILDDIGHLGELGKRGLDRLGPQQPGLLPRGHESKVPGSAIEAIRQKLDRIEQGQGAGSTVHYPRGHFPEHPIQPMYGLVGPLDPESPAPKPPINTHPPIAPMYGMIGPLDPESPGPEPPINTHPPIAPMYGMIGPLDPESPAVGKEQRPPRIALFGDAGAPVRPQGPDDLGHRG